MSLALESMAQSRAHSLIPRITPLHGRTHTVVQHFYINKRISFHRLRSNWRDCIVSRNYTPTIYISGKGHLTLPMKLAFVPNYVASQFLGPSQDSCAHIPHRCHFPEIYSFKEAPLISTHCGSLHRPQPSSSFGSFERHPPALFCSVSFVLIA